jgi:alpha-L-fucosidase
MFVGVFLCIISLLMSCVQTPPDMEKRAQELKDLRWGMFICWSFSTFSGRECTRGVEKNTDYATLFPAKTVDTDQWARVAKEAGMGYILFLTKHPDGFCLWDTKTTERKVTNAPLNKDVLAALKKSCDKYGIKLALYFAEGEWGWPQPSPDTPKDLLPDGEGVMDGGGFFLWMSVLTMKGSCVQ